eukprot:s2024_g8.t1
MLQTWHPLTQAQYRFTTTAPIEQAVPLFHKHQAFPRGFHWPLEGKRAISLAIAAAPFGSGIRGCWLNNQTQQLKGMLTFQRNRTLTGIVEIGNMGVHKHIFWFFLGGCE